MKRALTVAVLLALTVLVLATSRPQPCIATVVATPAPEPSFVPVVVVTASPTLGPTEEVHPVLVGIASTYGPGFDGYLAVPMREWRGKHVEVCFEGRCVVRVVNDLGPDQRVHPDRVVDLDVKTFEYLADGPWTLGLVGDVTVTLLDE